VVQTVRWKVTAVTIYCDSVDDDVTLMVYSDLSVKCLGYQKYGSVRGKKALKKKSRRLGRELKCEGMSCQKMRWYRDKLMLEQEQEKETEQKKGEL